MSDSTIESKIDGLYSLPLRDFTSARNALARTLKGDAAAHVKRLPKPTIVPWAINQVYWRARPAYDRLLKSGAALRSAQLAALKGRHGDVRGAGQAFSAALADAVARAVALAGAEGSQAPPDELARAFEALSLAPEHPERPGRLTRTLAPAGFEALAGLALAPTAAPMPDREARGKPPTSRERQATASRTKDAEAIRRQQTTEREEARRLETQRKRDADAERQRHAVIASAERALERAREDEARARRRLDDARERVAAAEAGLAAAKQRARF